MTGFVAKGWLLASCLCLLTWSVGHAEQAFRQSRAVSETLEQLVPQLMDELNIPGVSIALVEDDVIVWNGNFGEKRSGSELPITEDTVFEAASMSKPFFAYMVMQLAEQGLIDLDRPLSSYYGSDYVSDPRHRKMTARMVLSHKGGFPNWRPGGRNGGQPLKLLFTPGTDYTYSGEGYWYLQRTVEKLTGESLDELSRQMLTNPLGMSNTRFVWHESLETQASEGHSAGDAKPIQPRRIYESGNAAFTLYTTASDYAQFLIEMMRTDESAVGLLSMDGRQKMLSPVTRVSNIIPLDRTSEEVNGKVYFGLGWRIDIVDDRLHFCHSGSNRTGFRCYAEFAPGSRRAIVILTNSAGGHQLWQEIVRNIGYFLSETGGI